MKKKCELCKFPARMYCESDKASLCWDCDEKIHSANFLVARHSRSLLCHVCQSVTHWSASGLKLGHTVSVCHDCVLLTNSITITNTNMNTNTCCESEIHHHHHQREDDEDFSDDDDDSDDDDEVEEEEEEEEEVEEEEDGDNQVVPWTCTPPPPPQVTSSLSSSSEGEGEGGDGDDESSRSNRFGGVMMMMKRRRDDSDFDDEIIGCSASQTQSRSYNNDAISTSLTLRAPGRHIVESSTSLASLRPMKKVKRTLEVEAEADAKRSVAIINSLKRFERSVISENDNVAAAVIVGIRELSRDPRVIGLD